MMKTFLRDNGLIAPVAMFRFSTLGMIWSDFAAHNEELREHGGTAIGLSVYLTSGVFLSAFFENWESEFLQMSAYVMLTAMLFQRGSAEPRDPDNPDRPDDELASAMRRRRAILLADACGALPDFVCPTLVGESAGGQRGGTASRRRGSIVRKLPL